LRDAVPERLTDAAKIYWDNLDVLNEARSEFTGFLDDIYEQCKEQVEAAWLAVSEKNDAKSLDYWRERTPPGRWYINVPDSPLELSIKISDPRRSPDRRNYAVTLATSEYRMRKMTKIAKNALEVFSTMGQDAGVPMNWDHLDQVADTRVPIVNETASDTASELAKLVSDRIALLAKMDGWLRNRVVRES
jgi:hypothetical protein